jgi:MSHA biogenesis protein MshK
MSKAKQLSHRRAVRVSCCVLALVIGISYAKADTLIDPTRPANAPTKSGPVVRVVEPTSRLTAIFQSGDRRVAVLDGRVVKNGDRIGELVIQEILPDSVRYVRAGRVETARLPKQAAAVRSARKDAVSSDTARNEAVGKDSIRQEISP